MLRISIYMDDDMDNGAEETIVQPSSWTEPGTNEPIAASLRACQMYEQGVMG